MINKAFLVPVFDHIVMVPQHKVQGRFKPVKAGKYAVVAIVIMIYHVAKMEYRIQLKGIEYFNAAVKLCQR